MKKTLSLTLVMIFVLSFMAVANPFSDVPFSHWAYDAVAKLSARGIITGFPDGTFKGQRTVTRYELAMILARLMAKMDTPGGLPANFSLEDRRTVERLTVELADELSLLGVKVTALEDEVAVLKDDVAMMKEGHGGSCGSSMGALKVSGEFVLDYNDFVYDTTPETTFRGFRNFYTINLEAKPMKDVRFFVQFFNNRLAWNDPIIAGGDVFPKNDTVKLSYMEVKNFDLLGLMEFDKATFGRQNYKLGKGLLIDGRETGIVFESKDFDLFMFDSSNNSIADFWGVEYRVQEDMSVYYGGMHVGGGVNPTIMGLTYNTKLDEETKLGIEYAITDHDSNAVPAWDDRTAYMLDFEGKDWNFRYTVEEDGRLLSEARFESSLATDDTCLMSPLYRHFGFDGNVNDMFLKYTMKQGEADLHIVYETMEQADLVGLATNKEKIDVITLGYEKEVKKGVNMGISYSMVGGDATNTGTYDDIDDINYPFGGSPATTVDATIMKFQMRVKF